MKRVASKIKPKSGFSYFVHLFFTVLIPILVYVFVRVDLVPLALLIILLGKWRVFAVQPRHWWPNIRANGVDILVGVSFLGLMTETSSVGLQASFAGVYALWLLFLKPRSRPLYVALQAFVAQTLSLIVIFLILDAQPLGVLVLAAGLVSYISARHFFTNFDESHTPLYAHTWGYFAAAITWLLGHWLVFYPQLPSTGIIAQPALLLAVIGFSLGALYYLERNDRLSVLLQRQILFIMIAATVLVVALSDWGDKTI